MNYTFSPETGKNLFNLDLITICPKYYISKRRGDLVIYDETQKSDYMVVGDSILAPAYSVFDLLIPENAKKVWSDNWIKIMTGSLDEDNLETKTIHEWEYKSHQLLTLIQQGTPIEEIEEWLGI